MNRIIRTGLPASLAAALLLCLSLPAAAVPKAAENEHAPVTFGADAPRPKPLAAAPKPAPAKAKAAKHNSSPGAAKTSKRRR